jgi:hypothetical protein
MERRLVWLTVTKVDVIDATEMCIRVLTLTNVFAYTLKNLP